MVLVLGAASITGAIALMGHLMSRRSARESQQALKQQHDDRAVEWGRQHDQWRADFERQYTQWRADFERQRDQWAADFARLHSRWQREQTFALLDQAITRALSDTESVARVGLAQLEALLDSDLVQTEDRALLRAVTDATLVPLTPVVDALPPDVLLVEDAPGEEH